MGIEIAKPSQPVPSGPVPSGPVPTKPVYVAIQDYILELIGAAELGPGDRVPSERALAEQLGANRMTVRKAVDKLVDRGILERNGTSGTRLPLHRVARPIDAAASGGFTRVIRSGGGTPGNKLLHFGEAVASETVAARLRLRVGAPLIRCRRLWTASDTAVCIETSYLPAARFGDLVAEDLTAGQSLYGLLHDRYSVAARVAEREIGLGACTQLEARLLGLAPGSPALVLRLVACDMDGEPVEYMKSVNHPHLVVFRSAELPESR